jgi:hypothetical protein
LAVIVATLGALAACSRPSPSPDPSVHTLRLVEENVVLPDLPGRDKVVGTCAPCHSPRYLLEQPRFPQRTWQAEIDKMRTAYGAPVAEGDVPVILEYLVAIRGSGT